MVFNLYCEDFKGIIAIFILAGRKQDAVCRIIMCIAHFYRYNKVICIMQGLFP